MMKDLKIAFTTCVQLGKSCIEKILDMDGHLDLLITLKDEKAKEKSGRVYIDDIANKYSIPLLKVNNINDKEAINTIRNMGIDWLFVIGWSQIVKPELLAIPKKGCIGMHPTLLPKGRGRAAIPWAIIKGLKQTGVSMFKMDEGVDTGDILGQVIIPLSDEITATELYKKVDEAHIELLEKYWQDIVEDVIVAQVQDESQATVWEGRKPEDGEITRTMTKKEAGRLVRAVTHPYPGAFYIENGKKIVVWSAAVGNLEKEVAFHLTDGYLYPLDYEIKEEIDSNGK